MTDILAIFKELDKHFVEYLTMKGRAPDEKGFIRCLNPNHEDRTPSMSLGGSNPEFKDRVAHCFSCSYDANILHAAGVLDNKALSGVEFYEDTLPYLTKLFNIPYEPAEISDDVRREFQMKRAHSDAATIVRCNIYKEGKLKADHPAVKHLLERGISEEAIRIFKIGCIDSYEDYLKEMAALGWSDMDFLTQAGLANKNLFNKNGVIVPIQDEKNRTIGFVTRRTDMIANEHGSSKYVNSPNTNIYKKGEVLFGFNNFLSEIGKGTLFIVEGYLDCVMMYQAGIKNVSAIGATVLTDAHIDLLQKNEIKNIVICLDGDEGGRKGVKLALERLTKYKYFKIRIMELPQDQDPDTFIRANGAEEFIKQARPEIAMSPFGWTLKHTTFEDDPLTIAQNAIPAIANEESSVERLKMIRDLSRVTAISETEIKQDVDGLVDKVSDIYMEELKDLNTSLQMQLARRKFRDTKTVLNEFMSKVQNLEQKYTTKIDNKHEFKTKIEALRNKIENGDFKYGLKASKFMNLEGCMDGFPYNCCLTLVGGRPSAGKTAMLSALELNIVEENPDCVMLDMSIDDNTDLRSLKILAVLTGMSTSKIKNFSNLTKAEKEIIDGAWVRYNKMTERFIIADATLGNTIDALEGHINWLTSNYKDQKKIIVLDNFHKLRLVGGGNKQKSEGVSDQSQRIKDLVQIHDIHLMMTVELRKLENTDSKPHIQDLKDSVQLEYDADVVMLVHNEYQAKKKETPVCYHRMVDGEMRTMPYIEVEVAKNKINGRLDTFAYKLDTYNLRLEETAYAGLQSLYAKKSSEKIKSKGYSI
jgi:DNA primase catalytic core